MKEKYGEATLRALSGTKSGCCGAQLRGGSGTRSPRISTAKPRRRCSRRGGARLARLRQSHCARGAARGRVVLDLGSGGGIDVLLSARRVGPTGKAYGLDMTDEMLALARENQRKAGRRPTSSFSRATSSRFPLPDELGRRHHLELRDQPLGRQAQGARGGIPRPQARRPLRRVRRRDAGRESRQRCGGAWSCGSVASRVRSRRTNLSRISRGGFEESEYRADARLQGRGCTGIPGRGRTRQ